MAKYTYNNQIAKTNKKDKPLSQIISTSKRDDEWLLSRLDHLWKNYFGNVKQINPVFIRFGRFSKFRLGSIRLERYTKNTYVTITGMFRDPNIPVEVVDHTIAHELCHYTHGFSSPAPRLHKFPHSGGVIKTELESRGMHNLVKAYAKWLKEYRKTLD
jgi:hypothetical protein